MNTFSNAEHKVKTLNFTLQEAIAIVLDVGPSMNQAPAGEVTSLETAIDAITMIVQRKVHEKVETQLKNKTCKLHRQF